MYAIIRTGGKQYRVTPGDILNLEKLPQGHDETVTFSDVLAVSNDQGELQAPGKGASAGQVLGTVIAQAKAAKILVFHYKRKKQYKKLQGHRQRFTRVRVDSIEAAR